MLRATLIIFICLLFSTPAAAEPIGLTQRDLMFGLVEGLGWSFGLPDQPQDADYLKILNGERKLRIEVESNYPPDTRVIVEQIFTFGTFSGAGWIRVPNRPTDVPVSFVLPLSGEYRVKARLLRSEHVLRIGDRTFIADGGDQFTDVELGTVFLQAGRQNISLTLPPRGGIDFIDLEAASEVGIAPQGGWNLDAPLSYDDLAVTALQILDLQSALPPSGKQLVLEAETFPLPEHSRLSKTRYQGPPSQGAWVSVGADPTVFEADVKAPHPGVYDLSVRCVGNDEISGTVNSQPFHITPDRRFATKEAGGVVLNKGENQVRFDVPPYCGIDQIILSPRASAPEDFRRLTGLPLTGSPGPSEFDRFLKLLAAFGVTR